MAKIEVLLSGLGVALWRATFFSLCYVPDGRKQLAKATLKWEEKYLCFKYTLRIQRKKESQDQEWTKLTHSLSLSLTLQTHTYLYFVKKFLNWVCNRVDSILEDSKSTNKT